MTRRILVIGIGAGDPDHMTVQAIKALNQADVVFIPEKGQDKAGLADARRAIVAQFSERQDQKLVAYTVPERVISETDYKGGIEEWRAAVEKVHRDLITDHVGNDATGAFLVWGDPAIYDGTMRMLDDLIAHGLELDYEVIPGISSVQALAARHKVPLNRIGESVTITTGRRIAKGWPEGADTVVVMLDSKAAYAALDDDIEIVWGAYVGSDDEILISGKLAETRDMIGEMAAEARARNGWIMDTYLLRKPAKSD